MNTIDERCYGHEPAASQLKALRAERDALRELLREAHDVCTSRVREPVLVARIATRIDAALERQP